MQDKWPKGRVALKTEKNETRFIIWHPEAEPLGRFPPFFLYEYAPRPFTYIPGFIQISSGFGKLQRKNFSMTHQSKYNIHSEP